ncbi:MAG: hypothetical protein OEY69_06310, partial [Candidatus Krumholzibacteria bacterium]|nr:hypothetical protein [Candidatus Krumholzibacteria bacterium]
MPNLVRACLNVCSLVFAVLVGLAAGPARTADLWGGDGDVVALAAENGVLYVGGNFRTLAPPTGALVAIDPATGASSLALGRIAAVSAVAGGVRAAAPDGAGGWYVGGRFSIAGGVLHQNLAHVLSDGSVDPAWNPTTNQTVRAIVVIGSTVYVAGEFTQVNSTGRNRLAALDATTGALTGWNPNANGLVECMVAQAD